MTTTRLEFCHQRSVIDRLTHACPAIGQAAKLWKPSSSYGIHASNDASIVITGGGQRLYFAVQRAAEIPDAGQNLNLHLWAAGLGWIKPSKSGQPLKRTILDASVYQPERLDFAGPPILGPGVIREAPELQIIEGCEFLDLASLACDGDIRERATLAMTAAIEAAQPELRAAKEQWINALASDLAQRQGIPIESVRRCLAQASDHGQLSGDFLLLTENDDTVSVREVLNNPTKWHGTRFADPLEPSYGNNDHRIAWANLLSGSRPYIYSHAHGGIRYTLTQPVARIRLAKGDKGRITIETESALGALGGNRALLLITGNNISTRGDTFRRVLTARLDAKVETPYLRAFVLNPREYCLTHRHEMVVAGLTIVRAYVAAGCPRVAEGTQPVLRIGIAWSDSPLRGLRSGISLGG